MKPETGKTNRRVSAKQVSIQLMLGGHSFSADTLPPPVRDAEGPVECVVLTHKTLLVPREEFDETLAGTYLRLAGMACGPEETPVWTDVQQQVVAVIAAPAAQVEALHRTLGARRVRFATPLLRVQKYTAPTVWWYRSGTLLYIKVYDTILRLAEVLEAPGEADAVAGLEILAREFPLAAYTAVAEGDNPKESARILRRYFKQVVCE